MSFIEQFNNSILFFDGAMGTELQKNGLKKGELPENLNIHSPEIVERVHKSYLDAGCNIITTNTFGANSLKFNNVTGIITGQNVDQQVGRDLRSHLRILLKQLVGAADQRLRPGRVGRSGLSRDLLHLRHQAGVGFGQMDHASA